MAALKKTTRMLLAAVVLGGCSHNYAPVESRGPAGDRPPPPEESSGVVTAPLREAGPADKGGYTVAKGDTLYSIAFRYGLDYRALAAWNDIPPPYVIHPGGQLRLTPPERSSLAARTTELPSGAAAPARSPVAQPASAPVQTPEQTPTQAPASTPNETPGPSATDPPRPATTAKAPAGAPDWRWPTEGRVLVAFGATSSSSRRGIEIGGQAGQPVQAAAGGQVVYSGDGLLGYGELIIIKHDDTFLSAYANNRKRLVNEGDQVSGGQAIAEMGGEGAKGVLHFEIRKQGKPVDPIGYLPAR